ncbi:MAG TPA: hypothetical protein VER03_12960, partial [Bryobacteraceae bacterium]|nr:hypothetical protein [Bryobacteraceae bacterium]
FRLLREGRVADAVAVLELNLAEHGSSAGAHMGLAEAVSKAGDAARAAELWRRALVLNPQHVGALEALDRLR